MRRFIAVCTLAAAASVTAYATPVDAAPLKCPSNDVNAGPAAVADAVLTTDPVQKGHLYVASAGVPSVASSCAAPKAAPAVVDPTLDFHYKAHTFKNRSTTAACIQVRYTFSGAALGTGFHEVTAYQGSFDPNDIAKNYLGDTGRNEGGPDAPGYSITVPAMSDFVLVTTWAGPATPGYEPTYSLYVAGCGQMVVTGVTPNAGPVEGGQAVTVTGSGFEGTTPAVTIGSAANAVVTVDDGTLTATTGAHAAGVVDVSVSSGPGVTATLAAAYAYGGAVIADAGADAAAASDAGDGGLDAGKDGSVGGPTQGGPTQGSSSGGTTDSDAGTDDNSVGNGDNNDGGPRGDASTSGDGGAKRVSGIKKKSTGGDEELVCACNEVGHSATPGFGAFATAALAAVAVLRLKKRRR